MDDQYKIDVDEIIKRGIDNYKARKTGIVNTYTSDKITQVNYGTIECYLCNEIKTAEGAKSRVVEIQTGRSGGSPTIHGRLNNSTWSGSSKGKRTRKGNSFGVSYNMGRNYYRNIKVFVCADCLQAEAEEMARQKEASDKFWGFILSSAVIGLILYGSYVGVLAIASLF